jgi:hypothetical protein
VVKGADVIPTETKILTASGKVSVKTMPPSRFHEVYQDYVCSCMLRVAREVFALLPVDTVLLTAATAVFDPSTGHTAERPVLSVVLRRETFAQLDFERLDPSDAIDRFQHRGDFKASRKTGAFQPITPLTCADIAHPQLESMSLAELQAAVDRLRGELGSTLAVLAPQPTPSAP